ncbi:hypothetical protein QA802_26440 [Streptomyces sp. B21-105]|uniref:hypothetical protein n=1 Tax=Streptomyces sp. B21-105 TaxID=3039417 RepID=UPI002FF3C75B
MAATLIGLDETTRQDLAAEADPPWVPRARGRHRRPRPRKVLFAVGGLALAAGVLTLLRPAPDAGGTNALGATETEPQPDLVTSADDDAGDGAGEETGEGAGKAADDSRGDREARAGRAAAGPDTVAPAPTAPSAMGGASTGPAREAAGLLPGAPGAPTSVALTPGATYVPAPRAASPAPAATAAPKAPSAPTPRPATAAPASQPAEPPKAEKPRQPGLCVPIIGLCVDPLSAPASQR